MNQGPVRLHNHVPSGANRRSTEDLPQRVSEMPEISRFMGIVVRMYFADHEPPHFHASYGGSECQFRFMPVGVLAGSLPPRVLALVAEWATLHQDELHQNWRRLQANQPPLPIQPLE